MGYESYGFTSLAGLAVGLLVPVGLKGLCQVMQGLELTQSSGLVSTFYWVNFVLAGFVLDLTCLSYCDFLLFGRCPDFCTWYKYAVCSELS